MLGWFYSSKQGIALEHECAGFVEKIGDEVFACETGDLVTVEPHIFVVCVSFAESESLNNALTRWLLVFI